jgi:hypothetical protein
MYNQGILYKILSAMGERQVCCLTPQTPFQGTQQLSYESGGFLN